MTQKWLQRVSNNSLLFPAAVVIFTALWFVFHIPILNYGTEPLPIHAAYVGDEQGPINGALHILEERSIFALRDAYNTQYGPLISLLAILPALADFGRHILETGEFNPDSYKNAVIWNWTGILYFGRLLALTAGTAGLAALYLTVRRFGAIENRWLGMAAVLLLALNWHFFEYATYYRHWVFVSAILLFQVYFLLRLRQEKGEGLFAWAMLSLLAILGFGISYFGIFFQVLWLPTLVEWLRQRRVALLKKFFYHGLVIAIGCALVVAWVPGPFYRAIGIGYGDISKQGVEEYINEDYGAGFSFAYYAEVVGANNIALLLLLVIGIYILWQRRIAVDWTMLWSVALAALSYFVFFALQSHHEPRYILPSLVLLVVLAGMILSALEKAEGSLDRFTKTLVIGLVVFQILFHSVHIVQASLVFKEAAPEQAVLSKLLPVLAAEDDFRVLALRDNPFGYPHTKEAYDRYAKRFGFSDRGLFMTLQTTAVYPTDKTLLNFDYFSYFHLPANEAPDFNDFDLIIARHRPNEPDMPNERDRIDVNLLNWWYPEIAQEKNWLICVSDRCRAYEDTF